MSRTGDAVRHPDQGNAPFCPRRRSYHRRRPPPHAFAETPMDPLLPVVLSCCCGIDVHKQSLTACLLTCGASGEVVKEIRVFSTVTAGLQALAGWLRQQGCRHVAIESTGVYWKPVFNFLEPAGL